MSINVKLGFAGAPKTGKTTLFRCLQSGTWKITRSLYKATKESADCEIQVGCFNLIVTDTPGTEVELEWSDWAASLIVFSTDDAESMKRARQLVESQQCPERVFLFSNKAKKSTNPVKEEDLRKLKEFATSKGIEMFDVTSGEIREIFTKICAQFLPESVPPGLQCNFESSEVQNLVATAANGTTFVLTETGISVMRRDQREKWHSIANNLIHRPVMLKCNCDGTILLIATHFALYVIDKANSGFDPYDEFPGTHDLTLRPMLLDVPETQMFVDIQFVPSSPDHFVVAYGGGLIQVVKISDDSIDVTADFDTGTQLLSLRFPPRGTKNTWLDYSMFFMTNEGRVFAVVPFLLPYQTLTMAKGFTGPEEETLQLLTTPGRDSMAIAPVIELIGKQNTGSLVSFDFLGSLLVVASELGDLLYMDLGGLSPTFFSQNRRDFDVVTVDGETTTKEPVLLNRCPVLIAHGRRGLTIITRERTKVMERDLITSEDIIGFGGDPLFCIVAPGFKVDLSNSSCGMRRVDPRMVFDQNDEDMLALKKEIGARLGRVHSLAVDCDAASAKIKTKLGEIEPRRNATRDTSLPTAIDRTLAKCEQWKTRAERLLKGLMEQKPVQSNAEEVWGAALFGAEEEIAKANRVLERLISE